MSDGNSLPEVGYAHLDAKQNQHLATLLKQLPERRPYEFKKVSVMETVDFGEGKKGELPHPGWETSLQGSTVDFNTLLEIKRLSRAGNGVDGMYVETEKGTIYFTTLDGSITPTKDNSPEGYQVVPSGDKSHPFHLTKISPTTVGKPFEADCVRDGKPFKLRTTTPVKRIAVLYGGTVAIGINTPDAKSDIAQKFQQPAPSTGK